MHSVGLDFLGCSLTYVCLYFHGVSAHTSVSKPLFSVSLLWLPRWHPKTFLKELLEAIAKALVDYPEEVRVSSVEVQQMTVLELRVHPEDVGKVIGHHGRIATALRTIFGAAGMKLHKRVTVDID